MPRTDFRYEEFEGLLASYYLTFLPLRKGGVQDAKDFIKLVRILNGFATRYCVQKPIDAIAHPRKTEIWAVPQNIGSCFSIIDLLSSFWRDFDGDCGNPHTKNGKEQRKLGRLVISILHRHHVLTAEFQKVGRNRLVVGIIKWNNRERILFHR
ncbi:MAG: hypothetical protein NUV61_04025 [Candidatus Azambacteria bacterium]|nr:hypothetical protein [Candidatus Azambacteria bacterium]